MQSKSLKVGTDYAYRAWKSASDERVTVLETGVTFKGERTFYTSRPATHANGVRVRFVESGEERVVEPKKIVMTWEEHESEEAQAAQWQVEKEQAEQARRSRRATTARAMHNALVEKGVKVGISYTYDDENYAALVAAGFEPVEVPGSGSASHLRSAVSGLSDLMSRGTFAATDVAVLLGLETVEHGGEFDEEDWDWD